MYKSHEEESKEGYLPRVLQVAGGEGHLNPSRIQYIRGYGEICWMAERMSIKRGENYSSVVSFLRRMSRYDLLKTFVIARGATRSQQPPQRKLIPSN